MFNEIKEIEKIVSDMKNHIPDKKVVIGISGGKDSSVVAALAARAFGPDNVIGVLMPNGVQADIEDSQALVAHLGIPSYTIDIGLAYTALTDKVRLALRQDVPYQYETNTPARIRMSTLYGVAAVLGGRVLNTCNRSENILGFSTLFGDHAGSYAPIDDYTVTEVRKIGLALGLPEYLVLKAPSDGMCGSTDEQKLSELLDIPNFTYERLDKLIRKEKHDFTKEQVHRIVEMHKKMKFKLDIVQIPHPSAGQPDFFKGSIQVKLSSLKIF